MTKTMADELSKGLSDFEEQMWLEDELDSQPQHLRDWVISVVDLIQNGKFDINTKKEVTDKYSALLKPTPSEIETTQAVQKAKELAEALYPDFPVSSSNY
ncbi:MAG: hypothetical protein ABJO72_10985 [Hyphomicrobiales bacterium]